MFTSLDPVYILAPAKINLFLSVEGKRSDGYHIVNTVMYSVSLYDTLIFSFNKKSTISVICNHPRVPDYKLNLVDKAIRLFFYEMNKIGLYSGLGVSVHIRKKIPVGAGFGGGSSDAAATLLLLNRKFGFLFSKKKMISMGRKIGTDIPFFIFGKPAFASGIGDRLEAFRKKVPKFALLIDTGIIVSTGCVYEKLSLNNNLRLTKVKKKLTKSFLSDTIFDYKCWLLNDLESVTETEFPVINEVKGLLLEGGAVGALMSGSGSGVFGLFENIESAISASKFMLKKRHSIDWSIFVVSLLV